MPDKAPADFHNRLASLCAPEIAAAMRDQNCDRAADMITALAEMLGKTIARAMEGNARAIEDMLTATEAIIATEAAGMAGVINLATAIKNRKAEE